MPRTALNDHQIDTARARILAEAARIVRTDGYGALSMRNLAAAVGLSAGALYRYFPTRQHVLLGYCSDALDSLHHQLTQVSLDEPHPRRVIERLLIAYGNFALEDRDRFRLLFLDEETTKLELKDPRILAAYFLLQEKVKEAVQAGLLRPLPIDDIARTLWACVHGVAVLATTVSEVDFADAKPLIATVVQTTLRGLSPSFDQE